jgi:membrane protease YdiL (CAAX protease family)
MSEIGITLEMDSPVVHSTDRIAKAQFLRLSKWFTLVLCLAAAVLPLLFGRPGVWSKLGLRDLFGWQTLASSIAGLILGAIIVFLVTYWRPLHVIAKHLSQFVAWETFELSDCLVTALMAALGEEALFRGALQPLIGLVPTAVIFGLLHATSVAHIILASVLGLWLGWLYEWSGSLWSPIAAHLALDLVTGLILARTQEWARFPAQGD